MPAGEASSAPIPPRPVSPIQTLLGAVLLVIAIIAVVMIVRDRKADRAVTQVEGNPVLDLLGWVPATEQWQRAITVWTPDSGTGTPQPTEGSLIDRLGLSPQPLTLGTTISWNIRYGWEISEVTSWASAGRDGSLAVLDGAFDLKRVDEALISSGYTKSPYRGGDIFLLQTPSGSSNSPSSATAIGVLDQRIVTGSSPESVRAVFDAAQNHAESVADRSKVIDIVRALAPLSAIELTDLADLAIDCGAERDTREQSGSSGRYVVVAYGRLGEDGQRRTLIATSFDDEVSAAAALPNFDDGWSNGYANARGAGGSLAAFGSVSSVSQSGNLLVAEVLDGTEAGWARAGLRFAIPVCETAAKSSSAASPVAGTTTSSTAFESARASLPDLGTTTIFRIADLSAIARIRGVAAPAGAPPETASVATWRTELQPLPAFAVLAKSDAELSTWLSMFAIPLDSLRAIAEVSYPADGRTVAVLIGSWDATEVATALRNGGYASVSLNGVDQFALEAGPAAAPPAGESFGSMWKNVALLGSRIYVSNSQVLLRQVVQIETGEARAPDVGPLVRDQMLLESSGATAAQVIGVEAVRRDCAAVNQDVIAFGATWSAQSGGEGDLADILVVPSRSDTVASVGAALDRQIHAVVLGIGAASPVAVASGIAATSPLMEHVKYLGVENGAAADASSVIAGRLYAADPGDPMLATFFAAVAGHCIIIKP